MLAKFDSNMEIIKLYVADTRLFDILLEKLLNLATKALKSKRVIFSPLNKMCNF